MLKDTVFEMFKKTGKINYFLFYKSLHGDISNESIED
jgi:hypothetical protein